MSRTLSDIARLVGGEVIGDARIVISGVAGIQDARPGDITFLANPKYSRYLDKTSASAVIVGRGVESQSKALIRCDNPSLAFTKAVGFLFPSEIKHPVGIHSHAFVSKGASVGKNAAIGACAVIEDGAVISEGAVIYPGSFIGAEAVIGEGTVIYPNVSVMERVSIGKNVIVHSGSVIGSDGFGFVAVDGKHHKIPQVGTVVVEDDVEIGANVTIDRARFDKTVIGRGTKIDNLVHIAHNVVIGRNCLIVAFVGISGSSTLGDNVVLAGQVGVTGHVKIGDNSVVMAKGGVSKSIPADSVYWGSPVAQPVMEAKRIHVYTQSLPKLHDTIKELKVRVSELEKKLG